MRAGHVTISAELFISALHLPPDTVLHAMEYNPTDRTLRVLVEHHTLPECGEGPFPECRGVYQQTLTCKYEPVLP